MLWRSRDGGVRALCDVCVHRGTALSLGWVNGDEIVCAYHGWRYRSDGRCVAIPQLADPTRVPAKARVPAFRAQERYGLIWVSMDEPRWPLPELPELETDGWKMVSAGPYSWQCDAARQVENFTDFGHFPWVHPGLLGDPDRPVVPQHRVDTDGHVLRYEIVRPEAPNSDDFPVFGNEQAGPPERRSRYELHLPYTIALRLGWGGERAMVYFFASSPAAAGRCTGYVIIGRNYNLEQDDQVIRDFEDTIFGQRGADLMRQRLCHAATTVYSAAMTIEPYQAIGLVPTMRGIRHRSEIQVNLEHLSHLIKAASWLSSLDLPVKLIAIPEGALQGFNDEVLDLDHETFAAECAIDIPGPETDYLGGLARQWNAFVMAQAKARHPEFPGRFFNIGFVLDPDGEIILRHHKVVPLLPVEHSVSPHNVWDKWIELYGRNLDAFYPVADTAIGRLGFLMANEGSYPENARGLAMNGAEVLYRGPYPHPHVGNGLFEVQNRARALDNNLYLIACNVGTYYLSADSDVPIDTFGGGSAVIDYRGQIVGRHDYSAGSSWVAGTIDIEALRSFRASAQWDNWIKDLTTEQYQLIYEQPIYPKNLYLDRKPYDHAEYRREVIDRQIRLMHERDIWRRPGS